MNVILHLDELSEISRACFVMDKESQDSVCAKQCLAHCDQKQYHCDYIIVDCHESPVIYTHDMFKAIWDTLSSPNGAKKMECGDCQCAYDSIILVWNERFKVIQPHIFHEIQNVFRLNIKKLCPTLSVTKSKNPIL
jgi:hypothetical protein